LLEALINRLFYLSGVALEVEASRVGAVELDAEGEADGAAETGPPHEDGALPRDGGSITEEKREIGGGGG
jgi:hypothetical protein